MCKRHPPFISRLFAANNNEQADSASTMVSTLLGGRHALFFSNCSLMKLTSNNVFMHLCFFVLPHHLSCLRKK